MRLFVLPYLAKREDNFQDLLVVLLIYNFHKYLYQTVPVGRNGLGRHARLEKYMGPWY